MENKRQQNQTVQWVEPSVFTALESCAKFKPELGVQVKKLQEEQGRIQVKISIPNVGRNLFIQKLTHFLCISLLDFAPKN